MKLVKYIKKIVSAVLDVLIGPKQHYYYQDGRHGFYRPYNFTIKRKI